MENERKLINKKRLGRLPLPEKTGGVIKSKKYQLLDDESLREMEEGLEEFYGNN